MTKPTHIGIAGTFASGKDTLGHFLARNYNYQLSSSSDIVRKFSMERHGSVERPFLYETAEYYRKQFGADVFVKELLKEYDGISAGLIVSGLRATGEAQCIKDSGGIILFIDAPSEIRYVRMVNRERDRESAISYVAFLKREQAEWHNGDDPSDFSFKNLKLGADHILVNGNDQDKFFDDTVTALGLPRL